MNFNTRWDSMERANLYRFLCTFCPCKLPKAVHKYEMGRGEERGEEERGRGEGKRRGEEERERGEGKRRGEEERGRGEGKRG